MVELLFERWQKKLLEASRGKSTPLLQSKHLGLRILEGILEDEASSSILLPPIISFIETHQFNPDEVLESLHILHDEVFPESSEIDGNGFNKIKSLHSLHHLINKLDLYFTSLESDLNKSRWDRFFMKMDFQGSIILELNKKFAITKCNSVVEQAFGYRKIEVINKPITLFFSETSQSIIKKALKELTKSERYKIELELEAEGKSGRRFQAILKVLPSDDKIPPQKYTAHIQNSEQIQQAKNYSDTFIAALEEVQDGIILWDPSPEAKVLYVNRAMEKLTGLIREEMLDKPVTSIIKENNFRKLKQLIKESESTTVWHISVTISSNKGQKLKTEFTTKAIKNDLNQIQSYVSILKDKKDTTRNRPNISYITEILNQFIQQLPNFVIRTDENFRILGYNENFEKAYKNKKVESNNIHILDVFPALKPLQFEQKLDSELKQNQSVSIKFRENHNNGKDRYYHLQIVQFPEITEKWWLWTLTDITQVELHNFKIVKQNALLKFLENFSRIVNNNLELKSIAQLFTKELAKIFGFNSLIFLLPYDAEESYFYIFFIHRGSNDSFPQEQFIDISRDFTIQNLIQHKDPVISHFPENFEDSNSTLCDLLRNDNVSEVVQIPVILEEKIMGIMIFGNAERDSYDEDDLVFMRKISAHLAIALKNNIYFKFSEFQKKKFFIINSIFNAPQNENSILHICQNSLSGFVDILQCKVGGLYKSSDGEKWQKISLGPSDESLPIRIEINRELLSDRTIFWDDYLTSLINQKLLSFSELGPTGLFSWESSPSFGYIGFLSLHNDIFDHTNKDYISSLIQDILKQMIIALDQIILFEKIRLAENEWETTFNTVDIGIVVVDENFQIIRSNEAFLKLYHCDFSEIIGKTCGETFCRNEKTLACCDNEKQKLPIKPFQSEYFDQDIDRFLLRDFYPFHNNAGVFKGGIFTIQDETEKHKQKQAITFLSKFPENNPNIVLSLNKEAELQYINPTMHKILKQHNLAEKEIVQLLPADLQSHFEKLGRSKARVSEVEHQYKDRLFRYIIYHPSGQEPYYMYGMDITEKVNLQKQLIQTERIRALGEMAAGVAHDFNNLLATILGRTQLLLLKSENPEFVKELNVIEKAAMEGGQIVRRLQEVTREKRESSYQSLDINELIKESLIFVASKLKISTQLKNKNVHLKTDFKSDLVVKGDSVELKEVFTNILLNAFDAMPNGGNLYIKTSRFDKGNVRIILKDNGNGMPEDIRNKIFNPFFTTKGEKGTGLGLSIAYKNITAHGGSIKVSSQINKGTAFTITLPISEEPVKSTGKKGVHLNNRIKEANLLIVDDEPELLDTMAEILRLKFKRVEIAPDGSKALGKIKQQKFDVVLTDLGMPEMSGWELARRIKKHLPKCNVILVTGWGEQAKAELKHHPYVDEILPKPYVLNELINKINSFYIPSKKLEN